MPLTKPYYRIARNISDSMFLLDKRYAPDFDKASLKNVIYAAASVVAVLYAQFDEYTFSYYNEETMLSQSDDEGFCHGINSLFNIKPFTDWPPQDVYKFDWDNVKIDLEPFQKYPFK